LINSLRAQACTPLKIGEEIPVSDPILCISNLTIKADKVDDCRPLTHQVMDWLQTNRPRISAVLESSSEDGTDISLVNLLPDAQAIQEHGQGMGVDPDKARECAEITSIQIYGQPNPTSLDAMNAMGAMGIAVVIKPQPVIRFLRLTPR
jgi:hypothetical protein